MKGVAHKTEKMDSMHLVDDANTFDDSDDRSWLKLDDARPNHSVGGNDEKTTIEIVQQFLHELIESVETSCARYSFKSCHPDESECAVEGMLSLTNSIHLAQFSPHVHVTSLEDMEEIPPGIEEETYAPEENNKWDAPLDESTF